MKYKIKYFQELTGNELHNIYYLRCLVFVVEQNCPYQEVDEFDKKALHLMLQEEDTLIAYARILPPVHPSKFPRIGRVVVHPNFRGKGLGYKLMKTAIEYCQKEFSSKTIQISAQTHLKSFYQNLGFVSVGEEYLEDNIPHISMKLSTSSAEV